MTTSYDIELIRRILATTKAPVKAMDILTACQHLDPSTAHDVKNILQRDPHLIELVGEVRSFLESAASEGYVASQGTAKDRWRRAE